MGISLAYKYGLFGLIIGAFLALASSFIDVGNNLKVMFIMTFVELGFIIGLLMGAKIDDAKNLKK
ncbi:MAG: hypothetical protein M1375_04360 [Candidatus Thermoplasmatota archaeon]|nr:hypothetical protein [Candidatus Thermoplasmatota archaeon]MCL5791186.1 hypothetical protein [Candidatus Thermoplasmatota archaeon]